MTGCRDLATTVDGEIGANGLDTLSTAIEAGAGAGDLGLETAV